MGEIIFTSVDELSVSDVYDLACEIGKECEGLIATVGPDPVNSLIKKVIVSLELLERFATKNEQENVFIQEMSQRIQKLEAEKQEKTESRHKFEKEIETVEEQWRTEFNRLQEENRLLQSTLSNNRSVGSSSKESNGNVADFWIHNHDNHQCMSLQVMWLQNWRTCRKYSATKWRTTRMKLGGARRSVICSKRSSLR